MVVFAAGGVFAALIAFVVMFQFALAAGKPWGHLTMGGRFSGPLPIAMRVAAVVQAAVLCGLAVAVLARADLILVAWREASRVGAWVAVVVSGLSLLMNLATPSKAERRLWAPVGLGLLVCSLIVALAP